MECYFFQFNGMLLAFLNWWWTIDWEFVHLEGKKGSVKNWQEVKICKELSKSKRFCKLMIQLWSCCKMMEMLKWINAVSRRRIKLKTTKALEARPKEYLN